MSEFPFDVTAKWTRRWHTQMWQGPSEISPAWSSAVAAIERDLGCWIDRGPLPDFADCEWDVLIVGEVGLVHVLLRHRDQSGWNGFLSTGYPLDANLSATRTTASLADELQGDLTGHARIDWPSAGWDVLHAKVIDDTAVWVATRDRTRPVARIGHLCTDCRSGW
ncbi:hypothetical protein GOPIP_031_01670 [Gordonia polyisoprenivorans NBRC 16320 = JCM 10675]|nr:hypothetical protein CJJ17_18950 [Gordonia polyisoprenivorans]GAB22547.1 hypothetical protein GOPIP_031_01670 [Gordonia polyisoprenivorans NBRC 16320 = JCM 10675]